MSNNQQLTNSHQQRATSESSVAVGDGPLGRSLFAIRDIEINECIAAMHGPIRSLQYALTLPDAGKDFLQVDVDKYVELESPGLFANHSCSPNDGIRDMNLVAIQPISTGDEVCWDYSTSMGDGTWEMTCHCDEVCCRKTVRDFRELPTELQNKYVALNIVMPYLLRSKNDSVWSGTDRCS